MHEDLQRWPAFSFPDHCEARAGGRKAVQRAPASDRAMQRHPMFGGAGLRVVHLEFVDTVFDHVRPRLPNAFPQYRQGRGPGRRSLHRRLARGHSMRKPSVSRHGRLQVELVVRVEPMRSGERALRHRLHMAKPGYTHASTQWWRALFAEDQRGGRACGALPGTASVLCGWSLGGLGGLDRVHSDLRHRHPDADAHGCDQGDMVRRATARFAARHRALRCQRELPRFHRLPVRCVVCAFFVLGRVPRPPDDNQDHHG
mmetsp:Transcript_38125/g.104980  ORF Transcript_38125/g.104980 Transcript_38125/m.104980 type:complete len:257 (+) Transcript_38125:3110-3880(+)